MTYWDILRATLTRSDPKEFLFFNRNAAGKPAAKAFVKRLQERTADRDKEIGIKAFRTQLKAIPEVRPLRPPRTSRRSPSPP